MAALPKEGEVFAGRYRLDKEIGRGGMGVVFAATHLITNQRHAIKVVDPSLLVKPWAATAMKKRFVQEARISASLPAEYVARVTDADLAPTPFIAMDLLEGLSLDELVLTHGPLPSEQVVDYVSQLATGLDAAHQFRDDEGHLSPIVHCDLKPENVFITRDQAGRQRVRILDFGIAKILTEATKGLEVAGTALYKSYEQYALEPVKPATDIWALGLIVFFLLTGASYWPTFESVEELGQYIKSGDLIPASTRLSQLGIGGIPYAFDIWFARCVNRDQRARFSSAGEAARSLAMVFPSSNANQVPSSVFSEPLLKTKQIYTSPLPQGATTQPVASVTLPEKTQRRSSALAIGVAFLFSVGVFAAGITIGGFGQNANTAPSESTSIGSMSPSTIQAIPTPGSHMSPSASVEIPRAGPTPSESPGPTASGSAKVGAALKAVPVRRIRSAPTPPSESKGFASHDPAYETP